MAILSGGSADKFIAQQLNATDKRQIDNAIEEIQNGQEMLIRKVKEFNSDTPRKSVNFVPTNMSINHTATHVRENEHERKK